MGADTNDLCRRSERYGLIFMTLLFQPTEVADVTYLDIRDLEKVAEISKGNVHLTFGSALDIFGGKGVTLEELIQWNKKHESS